MGSTGPPSRRATTPSWSTRLHLRCVTMASRCPAPSASARSHRLAARGSAATDVGLRPTAGGAPPAGRPSPCRRPSHGARSRCTSVTAAAIGPSASRDVTPARPSCAASASGANVPPALRQLPSGSFSERRSRLDTSVSSQQAHRPAHELRDFGDRQCGISVIRSNLRGSPHLRDRLASTDVHVMSRSPDDRPRPEGHLETTAKHVDQIPV